MGERLKYIDIAKGIGIYSVVLVHFTIHGSFLSQLVLAYCVSVFFVLAGLMFNANKKVVEFCKSFVLKLLIPFIAYQMIDMVYTLIKYLVENSSSISIVEMVKIAGKATFILGFANSNGPLWFIPTLMYVELLMYVVCRFKKQWLVYVTTLLMLLAGYLITDKLYFRIGQMFSAFVLFAIGFLAKSLITSLANRKVKFVICPISLAGFLILNYLNGFTELAARNFGNYYIVYYLEVVFATVFILTLSMIIKSCKPLEYLGKNSMTIMCCHFIIATVLIPFIFEKLGKAELLENYLVEIVLSLLLTALMYPVCEIINRKVTILVGKNKALNSFYERKFEHKSA